MHHPFRFGVLARAASSRSEWVANARHVEDLGYSTIVVSDHFTPGLATLPALLTAAEVTGLRIGSLVLANDFRNPVVLAKEAATIDLLTEGRLELGIGTGWLEVDYTASGISFDPPKTRVDRLEEAVVVLRGVLGGEKFTHRGEHYKVDIEGTPLPVQQPLPLLIAGSGPRMLALAARHADIVSLTATLGISEYNHFLRGAVQAGDAVDRQVARVREMAGDRDPEINALINHAVVTNDRIGVASRIGADAGVSAEEALASPHVLVGTVDQICDDLVERRSRWGLSYPVLLTDSIEVMVPVIERLTGR